MEEIEKLGLDKKDVKVYLALLEMGETHIVPLAQKVELPRNTVVYILENLKSIGLVEILQRCSRRVYLPNPPEAVLNLAKRQKDEATEREKTAKSILPELKRLYSTSMVEPSMRFFKGQDEIRQIYDEMIVSGETEILYVGEYDKIVEVIGKRYLEKFIKNRIAKGIKTRSVRVRAAEVAESIFQSPEETIRQIRYSPADFVSPGHVTIYQNTVAVITTAKENFGFVVTSKEYAITMKSWFEQLWKVSKE
ncbi:MAG: helix-turn-helix domain-containing protein [Candidatus Berkelbacteria bacterium]